MLISLLDVSVTSCCHINEHDRRPFGKARDCERGNNVMITDGLAQPGNLCRSEGSVILQLFDSSLIFIQRDLQCTACTFEVALICLLIALLLLTNSDTVVKA